MSGDVLQNGYTFYWFLLTFEDIYSGLYETESVLRQNQSCLPARLLLEVAGREGYVFKWRMKQR
jgi:hypothetical protein